MQLHRPGIDTDRVLEVGATDDVFAGEAVKAPNTPGLANAHLRRDLDDVRVLEARNFVLHETKIFLDLPSPINLPVAELKGIRRVHGEPIAVADLGYIGAPFGRVLLRTHNRAVAGKAIALTCGSVHEPIDRLELADCCERTFRVHAADPKHHGWKEATAMPITRLKIGRQPSLLRAIVKGHACQPSGFGFRAGRHRTERYKRRNGPRVGATGVTLRLDTLWGRSRPANRGRTYQAALTSIFFAGF